MGTTHRRLEVVAHLRLVLVKKRRHRLQCHDDLVLTDEVWPIFALERMPLVFHAQLWLSNELNVSPQPQLDFLAFLVDRFQEPESLFLETSKHGQGNWVLLRVDVETVVNPTEPMALKAQTSRPARAAAAL
jgi:hypothetical protein